MEGIIKWISENGVATVAVTVALINAIIGIAMMIPGDQPEKFLQSVVDFIGKFSKKEEKK